MTKWVSVQVNKWMTEWASEWTNDWMSEWASKCEVDCVRKLLDIQQLNPNHLTLFQYLQLVSQVTESFGGSWGWIGEKVEPINLSSFLPGGTLHINQVTSHPHSHATLPPRPQTSSLLTSTCGTSHSMASLPSTCRRCPAPRYFFPHQPTWQYTRPL